MTEWLFPWDATSALLPDEGAEFRFRYALRHGSMKIGLYAPRTTDTQGSHKQDELYIVASGSGQFEKGGETRSFVARDAIFVEAGKSHRFFDFSDDFSAWVIFWGPDGGEEDGVG